MSEGEVEPLFDLIREAVEARVFPGAAFAVGSEAGTRFGYGGRQTYAADSPGIDEESLWDLASLTKVVATTPAVALLGEDRLLDLDTPVGEVLHEFRDGSKAGITVRHLLSHTSGLPAYVACGDLTNPADLWSRIGAAPLLQEPGERQVYSCVGFVVLMRVIAAAAGCRFEDFLSRQVYGPLGMTSTGFNPADRARCVPTVALTPERRAQEDALGVERVQGEFVQGTVHDPIALLMGGVSGNAGLFSTACDLARFCRAVLGLDASPLRTPAEWTRPLSVPGDHGLGWNTKSPEGSSCGSRFSPRSFGHLGYTGTSLWIDPENRLFAVLLTNRIHPDDRKDGIARFRPQFHDLAFECLRGR